MKTRSWKRASFIALVFTLGLLIGQAWSLDNTVPPGFRLVGRLDIKGSEGVLEDTIAMYRSKANDNVYLIRLKRNSIDSRFMQPGVELSGWIEIPVPIPLIPKFYKKHTVKYKDSDLNWDYFWLTLAE